MPTPDRRRNGRLIDAPRGRRDHHTTVVTRHADHSNSHDEVGHPLLSSQHCCKKPPHRGSGS
eukprot:scaffold3069_cov215-Amphora_coffeaeformis.AAC.22